MHSYLVKINAFIKKLDVNALSSLNNISVHREIKKGSVLLRQGEICKNSYFIEKGVARKYYLNDGKEITTELYFDNDIALSLNSYSLQKPSIEIIHAITDLNVLLTDYEEFEKIKNKFPQLIALDLLLTECYATWLEERLFQFHTLSATERYIDLLKNSPHYIQSIPLKFIASYIGISIETLSRIRAKL